VTGTVVKPTKVAFDGFTFDASSTGDTASNAVDCTGGSADFGLTVVTITRSTISGAPQFGVSAQSKCTIVLDADLVSGNNAGGLSFITSDYTLTNLLIRGNGKPDGTSSGSAFGGINFGPGGETAKMLAFNLTIVGNHARSSASGAAGIGCALPPTTLANVVLLDNDGGFEILPTDCKASYTAWRFKAGDLPGNNNRDLKTCTAADIFPTPAGGNFAPKKDATPACTLVDVGTNTGAPDHDFTGAPRSGPVDIGAFEAR